MSDTAMKEVVKQKYGQAALRVQTGGSSCCGASPSTGCCDPITSNLYDAAQLADVPAEALQASLGCGNPTLLAELHPGETVLDLGSGGGIDGLLSARRVGPTGKAYGLDMTDEMLALANENKRKAGAENVEFLKGEIESIPLPDNSVDVIISNCVINLSADKDRVLREAFRVLRPGGRFAVSDVVTRGEIAPEIRQSVLAWVGCIAGALDENDYRAKLSAAGFESVEIEPTRIYKVEDAREFLASAGVDAEAIAPHVDGKFLSAFIRAVKPANAGTKACCGPKSKQQNQSRHEESFGGKMNIRERQAEDFPAIGTLLEAAGLPSSGLERTRGWVAEECCQIISHIAMEEAGDAVVLRSLATAPAAQGRGIAKRLMDLAEAEAGNRVILLRTRTVGPWVSRRGYSLAGSNQIPASVRATSEFEGSLCSGFPVYVRHPRSESPTVEAHGLMTPAVGELADISAAMASNCEPCFKFHFAKARKLGVSRADLRKAVNVGLSVKSAPHRKVVETAERFLSGSEAGEGAPNSCCGPAASQD